MTTFTAFAVLPERDLAEDLAERLEDLDPGPYGVGVFEIEDGSGNYEVGAYFLDRPDDIVLDLLAAAYGATGFVISELPETDWVAHVKRELAPVVAGRFFVHGSHDADKVPEGAIPLVIDAAMAFGTGHHGTTLGCLTALDRLAAEGVHPRNSVDIGCGTAVLAMAAAKLWPETVLASDIDPVAVETAAANVTGNDLAGRVICLQAAGFAHPDLQAAAPFDLIFANILKGPLIALAPDMGRFCAESGLVILSGILIDQGDEVIAAYQAQGFRLVSRDNHGDWTTLVLSRT
ncbi:50S ribosomal protein L11 methyltransferase [Rhodobacter capsulatus]|jgi:ribosomal protein L11 methyltransferase|uniref:Ribosomal protein L11 methyltransferase n=1 Tax=Rhodobacter capsulatus (strain ATCC BAA-309 / NBRC 16581 / SB1003) TaxID=272942 RepID=D5ARD1_RHOCB|nr:50S ribosomal protein L11 methyltransferase [Rhodobacter capsulatus]ADE86936.1 ribosomal protein L11 methyltransferase [Rhodobacter capsulatus SB 1003]ETD00467.1 ribosomal L11 methyltransferase [Rhodobacter capsulatus DE442]ETD74807.1 ribosomal L11 methyltransferase [Rhodobacter capsulatus R121]ETE52373.1 ribosomal L11 methyltransferase [Rhodobacter capsulatus Y262]MDS0928736.1 50S ribosomal protein L11 methyltransferase [Rhodobacter capsulatus]